ncbi:MULTISPECIES: DEAD/DEAH box helicase [unclassified Undibacterium]|uniref:DEAD/DEAH box helicase n=2 Tax=Pseudomonadota TaxID=1224 RepID=UPI002AC9CD87|nr:MULTISPECIES: DEAD/DEAH box helicase [unclassified Undibacterium]MEB0140297.1 DEAD/DEAH box helicase [Undibacterium sp. CCC2.1]MEB0173580.1 DEAD/DEAH box helicase [Undibacterium sp. CCC1.1]MEB0177205.1 DEAD/DEAH box helicase [Undibacterium sp. CCC3.4]MEB0216470.1 DEAD/DEAH box helicase [Undibacterium sp. 5I2]WPX43240.1 DEAD/DEAH box helicase [Undibacterium sp. CCC3.4]
MLLLPPIRFQPRLTLRTLTRGDGVLGLRPVGLFGPRGGNVSIAELEWIYHGAGTGQGEWRGPADQVDPADAAVQSWRDLAAEIEALACMEDAGMHRLPASALQWRADELAEPHSARWSLLLEASFGDFWTEQLPLLQARGWQIVIAPGFAHESVPVERWHLLIEQSNGEVYGKVPATALARQRPRRLGELKRGGRSGWWMLSLGMEIDGEAHDLVAPLAGLLQSDRRWLRRAQVAAIDDQERISLRLPGGRRVDAAAALLKPVIAALLDLLTDTRRPAGPLHVSSWDAARLEDLCAQLANTTRSGVWQISRDANVTALAQRLRLAGAATPVAAPEGLAISLRPYQLHGLAWLQYLRTHGLGGILADEMGLGKTAQVLAHILLEQQAGRLDQPALVVLPTSLVFNWQAEARRMTPSLRVLALHGPERAADFSRMGQYDIVLTTYPLVWRDLDALARQPFHLLILDEAQTVKNAAARSAGAIRRLQARHRLCMTGTPMENHLGELWSQFDFLMPGWLGDARSFSRLWRKPIEEQAETARAQLLAQRVRPFILRRRKEDVATDIPQRNDIIQFLQLEGQQRSLYESVRVAADRQVKRALERSGFTGARIRIMNALLKLRQVCCDPLLLKGEAAAAGIERAKMTMLCDMLPALLLEGRRVLVFSQFTEMLDLIASELAARQLGHLMLTGKVAATQRAGIVAAFQNGETAIFLVSLKAGGTGLNLTAADTVILVDPWWNPAVEEQAIARAHRIGQTKPVFVYKLVVAGSIEERMLELQARKALLSESVLGTDAAVSEKFSAAELAALMAPLRERS